MNMDKNKVKFINVEIIRDAPNREREQNKYIQQNIIIQYSALIQYNIDNSQRKIYVHKEKT